VWVEGLSTPCVVQGCGPRLVPEATADDLLLRMWFSVSETATNRDCTGIRCSVEVAQLEQ